MTFEQEVMEKFPVAERGGHYALGTVEGSNAFRELLIRMAIVIDELLERERGRGV